MPRFAGKVAYVTGGASGIGAETARLMVAEGGKVALADLNEDGGSALAAELGDAAAFVRHDVTNEDNWTKGLAEAAGKLGPLTTLVNSAGISVPSGIEDATLDHWRQTMQINADSVFLGSKYGVAALKEQAGAAIVNIASSVGLRPTSVLAAYAASKAAVISLTKTTALHCAEQGYDLRVNAVLPGATRTPMMEWYLEQAEDYDQALAEFTAVHPIGVGQAIDIANAVLYLASDEARKVTGVSLPVDGGYCSA